MKIKLSLKLLAAFLAIIMLVGVFPMSVFAIAADEEYTAPNAEQIKERLGTDGRLVYFNDFDSTTGSTDFNTGAVTDGVTKGVESRVGANKLVDDVTKSGRVLQYTGGDSTNSKGEFVYKSSVNVYTKYNVDKMPEYSGKSFAWSADVKLGDKICQGYLLSILCSLPTGNISVTPLYVHTDGSLYYGASSYSADRVIATLSADAFINIGIHVDVQNNTYAIYLDGKLAVANCKFLTDEQIAAITACEGFENGFALTQVGFYRESALENFGGSLFQIDNLSLYFADSFISFDDIDTEADRNFQISESSYIAPNATDIKNGISAGGKLIYYNDFEKSYGSSFNAGAVTDGTSKGIEQRVGASVIAEDTVRDGKILKMISKKVTKPNGTIPNITSFNVYSIYNVTPCPANSGKSFVWSADIKLGNTIAQGYLTSVICTLTDGTNIEAQPLYVTNTGVIYYGSSSYSVGRTIGKLSYDKYVNVALHVNVAKNTYDVYIDGELMVDDYPFLTDAQISTVKSYEGFENGFAVSQIGIYRESTNESFGGELYHVDNLTYYLSDTFVTVKKPMSEEYKSGFSPTLKASDLDITKYYKKDAEYWQSIDIGAPTGTATVSGNVRYLPFSLPNNSDLPPYQSNVWQAGYAGLDVAASFDIKMDSASTAGSHSCMQIRTAPMNGTTGTWGISFIKVTVPESGKYELWFFNSQTDTTGYKIADLSDTAYTNVRVLLDAGDKGCNYYYVFVDKVLKGCGQFIKPAQALNIYNQQASWEYTGDTAPESGIMFGGLCFNESKSGTVKYAINNTKAFYYNDDASGDARDSERKINVPVLMHYNDFENQSITASGSVAPVQYPSTITTKTALAGSFCNSSQVIIDDGRGGKAATYLAGASNIQRYYQMNAQSNSGSVAVNLGSSYVISFDFKQNANIDSKYLVLVAASMKQVNAGDWGTDWGLPFLFLKNDGGLYVANNNGGVPVNYYTYEYADILAMSVDNPENKIGQINVGEFTSVAVSVHPSENYYTVYLDGIDATGKLPLLSATDLAALKESTGYKGEAGISFTRLYLEDIRARDSRTVVDNYALYFADAPIYTASGFIRQNDGKLYLYEDGKAVAYKSTADGIFTTDKNGALKLGQYFVYSLSDYYIHLGNDLVLKDGVYSGFYRAGSLLGQADGNLYYYDANKTRVSYKTAYDIKNKEADTGEEAVGFSFDSYGIATPLNGVCKVEGGYRFYVNGVRKTGIFVHNGSTYRTNAKGYLTSTPYITDNGYYAFNTSTFVGTFKATDGKSVINLNTSVAYASLTDAVSALADGETLALICDITADELVISSDKSIRIDLNGKTVSASGISLIGNNISFIDTGDTKGLLKIPKDGIASTVTTTDSILAWNSARGGYVAYTVINQKKVTTTDDRISVVIRPSLDNDTLTNKAVFGGGPLASGLKIVLTANAYNGGELVYTRNFVFGNEYVKLAYLTGKAMKLTCYCTAKFDDVRVSYSLISSAGITCTLGDAEFSPTYSTEAIKALCTGVKTTTVFSPESTAILNNNSGLSSRIQTVGGKKGMKWTSSTQLNINLPTAIPTMQTQTFTISIYSEAVKDTNIYLYLSPCAHYVEIPINFVGWKDIEIKRDAVTVVNPTPDITRVALKQASGSETANIWFGNITANEYQYELSVPEGIDINDEQIFEDVMNRYCDYTIGDEASRSTPNYTSRLNTTNSRCADAIKLFNETYTGADMKNGLFGLDIRIPSNGYPQGNGYVSWDEDRTASIYQKINYMAQAYATYGSNYYKDAALLDIIVKSLEYGYNNYYGSYLLEHGTVGNWYPWDIGIPVYLLPTLVYLRDDLTPEQIDKYLEPYDYLQPFPEGNASNLANMARCVMLASCLRKDAKRLAVAEYIFSEVFEYVTIDQMGLGSDGGFFTDGSYVQHNVTPYHGSYGIGLMQNFPMIMYMTSYTAFDMRGGIADNQFDFVTDSFIHVMYDNKLMSTTNGRAVGTGGEVYNFQSLLTSFIQMYSYAPSSCKEEFASVVRTLMFRYGNSLAANVPSVFYNLALELYHDESVPLIVSDYVKVMGNMARVVQHTPKYGVAIALSNKRIHKYESINGANFTGWYHGDGMLYLYTGDSNYATDYSANFYFYANPYLMPGTTVNSAHRKRGNIYPTIPNKYSFAGGVEQGSVGVSGFHLGYDWATTRDTFYNQTDANIEARKSYFMFDNELVCLGSGIVDTSGTTVRTVVDNRLWGTNGVLHINGTKIADSALHTTNILTPNSGVENTYYGRFDHPASNVLLADYMATLTGVHTMHFSGMGGYVFLDTAENDGNTLKYSKTVITGDASTGTITNNGATGTQTFLEIALEHGTGNSSLNGAYTYIYLPESSVAQTESYYADPDVEIIARTNKVHSVLETTLRSLGAVFFEADTLTVSNNVTPVKSITAKNGCCVMITTNAKGETQISVSDPTNSLTSLCISVELTEVSEVVNADEGVIAVFNGNTVTLNINCTGNVGNTYNITVK